MDLHRHQPRRGDERKTRANGGAVPIAAPSASRVRLRSLKLHLSDPASRRKEPELSQARSLHDQRPRPGPGALGPVRVVEFEKEDAGAREREVDL